MTENSNLLLSNMLNARAEFRKAKYDYINAIQEFCGDAIEHIDISFHGNKMYVTFMSWGPFDDKFLLKFCNEFCLLSPIIKIHQYTNAGCLTSYEWKFIKILKDCDINV